MSGHVIDYFLGTISAGFSGCHYQGGIQHLQLSCVFSRWELLGLSYLLLLRWWTAGAQLRVSIPYVDTEGWGVPHGVRYCSGDMLLQGLLLPSLDDPLLVVSLLYMCSLGLRMTNFCFFCNEKGIDVNKLTLWSTQQTPSEKLQWARLFCYILLVLQKLIKE